MRDKKGQFVKGFGFWTGKKRSEEDKLSMSKSHLGNKGFWVGKKRLDISGEKSVNWKGGVTTINEKIRKSPEYRDWRIAVFERDNYTCQECGSRGVTLNADHIKPFAYYPELRLAIDNGRTLCVSCHKKTETFAGRAKKLAVLQLV